MRYLFSVVFLLISLLTYSQQVGIGTRTPHPSAVLDISDSTRGVLISRVKAAKRLAINNPAEGLMVYQTDGDKGYWFYDGSIWKKIDKSGLPDGTTPGQMMYWNGSAWTLIPPGADGDDFRWCGEKPSWGLCPVVLKDTPTTGNLTLSGVVFIGQQVILPRKSAGVYEAEAPVRFINGDGYFAVLDDGTSLGSHSASDTWDQGVFSKFGLLFPNPPKSGLYKINFNYNTGNYTVGFLSPIEPSVTTTGFSNRAITTAFFYGNIPDDGSGPITARGFCWTTSSTELPTIQSPDKTIDPINDTGNFVNLITGLVPNTTYYCRAYATNSAGTSYGDVYSFTTLPAATVTNRYDGLYIATGSLVDNANSDISAPYTPQFNYYYLEATGPNSITIKIFANGDFTPLYVVKFNGALTYYTSLGTQLDFNLSTNQISGIKNYYGDPVNPATFVGDPALGTGAPNYASSSGRYLTLDWSGSNRYDPGTKKIFLKYYIFQPSVIQVGPRCLIQETLTYIGPR
jgi:hypothetical protein